MARNDADGRLFGRHAATACFAFIVVGIAAFVWASAQGLAVRAFGVLLSSWLFFTGTVLGAVVFLAVLELTKAGWAAKLTLPVERLLRFIPVAALLLGLLVLAHRVWAPWAHAMPPARAFWLNGPFFVAREVVAGGALLGVAHLYGARRARGTTSGRLAVVVCLVYAAVLSIWAYDFVLGLDPEWVSTLIGPHLFVGAFLSGIGLVTLLAIRTGQAGEGERHDLGKLLFGFSLFWAYLVFSQYLPIWYANLPEETGFVLRRVQSPWRAASIAVIGFTFVLPFAGLLHERAKRAPFVLGLLAGVQLLGLWLERHLLVVPSLLRPDEPAVDLRDGLIALGLLGAYVLLIGRPLRRKRPQAAEPQEHGGLITFPLPRRR